VFNTDGIGKKSAEQLEAGLKTNVTAFTEPESEAIADLIAELNDRYGIGLVQSKFQRERPGDDDGSFINAGYASAVLNIGSYPYKDPNYHLPTDTADTVDIENAAMAAQLILAAVLKIDQNGAPQP